MKILKDLFDFDGCSTVAIGGIGFTAANLDVVAAHLIAWLTVAILAFKLVREISKARKGK